jgi:signal transduction histidine kinase
MTERRIMGGGGGAADARPRAAAAAPARDSSEMDQQDFPLIIANMPATAQQRAMAAGVAAFLIVAAAVIAPFASIQLGQINGFIQVLQTALSLAEFITAALLFSQFSIQPQGALLALACGYMFSASFALLQTLAFPGGYAAEALIGDGPNSSAWIYVLWHLTFPAAILVYALSKDAPGTTRPGRPATRTIAIAVACTLAAIALLTWIVTTKAQYLPSFYAADVRFQTLLGNQINLALLLWCSTALAVLLFRRRTILDLWLMVTLLAYMPNFLVALIGSSVRFTVGWYAARGFVLVGSCMLLTVLLTETMLLYSRLASAMALQRRERTNRLLSVEAVTGAIAHELRTPLAAIALNASTGLSQLRSNPRELQDMEEIFSDIEADCHRAAAMMSSIRDMTSKTPDRNVLTSVEDAGRLALRLLRHDLQVNEVAVTTEFQENLPEVRLDGMEFQQVLLNLVRNAIDAMSSQPREARRLALKTRFDGQSTVLMSVEDSGPGISAADQAHIFDPFFTTKPGGMGLGLAISSTLVANHGGRLRLVRSDADGSVFELAIPIVAPVGRITP